MKKLFAVIFALGMVLALTACGKAPIKLVTTSANGISMDVPSDFGTFEDKNGVMVAVSKEGTATISVSVIGDGAGSTPADIDQDTYQKQSYPGNNNVEIVKYDNAASCNGIPAVSAVCKVKDSNGTVLTAYSFLLFYEDGTVQSVSINYNANENSSTKDNIDAIVKSIKVK